jgi:hypothetical protein
MQIDRLPNKFPNAKWNANKNFQNKNKMNFQDSRRVSNEEFFTQTANENKTINADSTQTLNPPLNFLENLNEK